MEELVALSPEDFDLVAKAARAWASLQNAAPGGGTAPPVPAGHGWCRVVGPKVEAGEEEGGGEGGAEEDADLSGYYPAVVTAMNVFGGWEDGGDCWVKGPNDEDLEEDTRYRFFAATVRGGYALHLVVVGGGAGAGGGCDEREVTLTPRVTVGNFTGTGVCNPDGTLDVTGTVDVTVDPPYWALRGCGLWVVPPPGTPTTGSHGPGFDTGSGLLTTGD